MQKVTLFLILVVVCTSLKAQFSVGVRQGYSAHGVYFEPGLEKYQVPYYRLNTGLVISFNNVNNVGLQTEFNYAQKGWMEQDSSIETQNNFKERGDTLTRYPYFKRNINYLEVPFFSHFEIGQGKVRLIILAGPYLAFKLSESIDTANFSHIWNEAHKYKHYEQEIRDVSYGIKLGLGLRYNITPRLGIFMDARYDLQIAGGRDIFIDRPNGIVASRLKEIGGSFGIFWHIIPQTKPEIKAGYTPKQDIFEEY